MLQIIWFKLHSNGSIDNLDQASKETNPTSELHYQDYKKHGITIETGFHSLAVIYAVLGLSNWFAPAIVNKIGQIN